MPNVYIVFQLIFIKTLIYIKYTNCDEIGYHVSAEEFDTFLREYHQVWPKDILLRQRQNAWNGVHKIYRNYTPKYKLAPKMKEHEQEHIKKTPHASFMSSDDQFISQSHQVFVSQKPHFDDKSVFSSATKPTVESALTLSEMVTQTYKIDLDKKDVSNSNLNLSSAGIESVFSSAKQQINKIESLDNLVHDSKKHPPNVMNTSESNSLRPGLPILFTNPVTGIDYAVIEVGKHLHTQNQSKLLLNDSIPIFITKQQYDRDLFMQRKYYEHKCQMKNAPFTTPISTKKTETSKPFIIRLQNLKNYQQTPSPITIRKEVVIRNNSNLNLYTQRVKKKRKTHAKRPGKRSENSTVKPTVTATTVSNYPEIIHGNHKPITHYTHTWPTQIENPISSTSTRNVRMRRSVNNTTHLIPLSNMSELAGNHNLTESTTVASTKLELNSTLIKNVGKIVGHAKSQRARKKKRVNSTSSEYDLFDFVYENDDTDSNDVSDYEYDYEITTVANKTHKTKQPHKPDLSSSAEYAEHLGALEQNKLPPLTDPIYSKFQPSHTHLHRDSHSRESDQSDDDYDYEDSDSFGGFFRVIFDPVKSVFNSVLDSFKTKNEESRPAESKYTTYTLYENNILKDNSREENSEEQSNGVGNWLGSWFGFNTRTTKKISSTTTAMPEPQQNDGWLGSWFSEDFDDYGWFGSLLGYKKTKTRRTTTHMPAVVPQVPILTIVDPHKNPQHWIGLLSNQVINATAAISQSPSVSESSHYFPNEISDKPFLMTYNKYQIWRLKPQSPAQVRVLEEYKEDTDKVEINWLRGPTLR